MIEITMDQDEWVEVLSDIKKGKDKIGKGENAIYEAVHIKADENEIKITAATPSMRVERTIEKEGKPGELCVNMALLSAIVSKAAPGDITVWQAGNGKVKVESKNNKSTTEISSYDPEIFPPDPNTKDTTMTVINSGIFKKMIAKTNFAAARTMSTTAAMGGQYMKFTSDRVVFIGGSNSRAALAFYRHKEGITSPDFSAIIPADTAIRIASAMPDDEAILIESNGGVCIFHAGNIKIWSQTIEGTYYDFEAVTKRSTIQTTARMDRHELMGILDRAAIIADQNISPVKFDIANEKLIGSRVDARAAFKDETDAEITGPDLQVHFDTKLIWEVIRCLEQDEIECGFAPIGTCLIQEGTEEPGKTKLSYLIAPVNV